MTATATRGIADRGEVQISAQLRCVKELKIIPGATHLFEEPGKLEEVASLAAKWF